MIREGVELPKLVGHYCFGCGTENPRGLNLYFYRSGDAICADITLDKHHEGWANMVHGGIISTLFDEVMSWTILYFKRIFFVTRKMEVRYIRPALIGVPLTVRGKITNAEDPASSTITARAEMLSKDGSLLAKATGEFFILPPERLSSVPEDQKRDMTRLFERLDSQEGWRSG